MTGRSRIDDPLSVGAYTTQFGGWWFVRCQLMRLKMGDHLTHVVRGGAKHLIAPAEEVLALKPELAAAA